MLTPTALKEIKINFNNLIYRIELIEHELQKLN
jgi:hypothetical protein